MNYDIFGLKNFTVLEDNNNYYLFRALNKADNADIINHFLETSQDPVRIRTDRERFEEIHGLAKYNKDSEISLEEMYDHIKMHYIKETNCISLSSNSCVSLDYGGNYFDEYAIITVPKDNTNTNVYPAGQYMLTEVSKRIDEVLKNTEIDGNTKRILNIIDRSSKSIEIYNTIDSFIKVTNYGKNVLSRFQDRQYFTEQQQLEYNRIIAKATILEMTGILPSIIPSNSDNQSLIASIGMAFSSGEVIYYKDIPKENFKLISKKMLNLISLTQQLKEKNPSNKDIIILERRLIELINEGYDIKTINNTVVLTNGTDTIDTGLAELDTEIFNKSTMDNNMLSVEEIYNITGGRISYAKAKKAVEFCYTLSQSKKEVYDYAFIISAILGNNNLLNPILNTCFIIDSKIIDRSNNNGHKVCESVNIGLENKGTKYYSLSEQSSLISLVQNLNINQIETLLQNSGIIFRNSIIENFELGEVLSKNEYFASSIIDSVDFNKIFPENTKEEYITEIKEKLTKVLADTNISRLYNSFTELELSHDEISYYIFNLFIEKRLKGYTFEEICELDNLDEFIKDNFSVFNKDVNELTLNNYLGIFTDSNYVPNSKLCLRDFQQRIKMDVDRIHADDKRFAGVIVPTGGGKSFIAMAEMMERKDSKLVYIAPRINILRNFKKNIVEYIAGLDPEGLSDSELDIIAKDCFPHLELICYQSLDENDIEKLASFKADYIILDEVHHIGGASWNRVIKKLLDNNPNSQVLGISATPQRDEYTEHQGEEYFDMYGGDMMMALAAYLDDYTPEELRQKQYLACDINIIDAIQEGYVICPNIVSFDYALDSTTEYEKTLKLARKIKDPTLRRKVNDEVEKMLSLINDAKLTGMDTIISEHIRVKNGKYILFIPRKPSTYEGTTDEYVEEYIKDFLPNIADIDSAPHIDYIHSGRGDKVNLEVMRNFEVDDSDHMKILVAIDMLNEGVHLPNINGSFNFRKIDSGHLILSLQHLGRVIYALDPNKEYTEGDIPVVFDKFNIYTNLDFDRLVNKKSITSDLEKLKDAIFWIDKYGRFPNVNSKNKQEIRKAITLKRIQESYAKFINADYDKYNLSEYDKKNTEKIIELCNKYEIWSADFGEISVEQSRKIERVELFNVSATKSSFLDICSKVNELAGISVLTPRERLKLLLKALDILAENNIELNPNVISQDLTLKELLNDINGSIKERILYELKKLSLGNNYPIGAEYYTARKDLYMGNLMFAYYDFNQEEINNLRRYGILCNGPDFTFIDERGFIINGPKKLLRKNIYTGTYYGKDNGNIEGIDSFGFNVITKIHQTTKKLYNEYGFNFDHIHKDTNTQFNKYGFDINHIHKDTGTKLNKRGFDINGNWYKKISDTEYATVSYSKYDEKGYDIDGYNRKGFNRNNIHRITGQPYDEQFFGNDDFYWELGSDGARHKTDRLYNDKMFDRKGYLYELDKTTNKICKKGQVYNEYGFLASGLHHKTGTILDPDGYDIDGIWYRMDKDGKYISTGSIFNDKGWTRDKKTIRHNVYGVTYNKDGQLFLDYVDDYGFDYKGRYHRPIDPIDKDGFVEFHKDIIMYSDELYHANNLRGIAYDIHHFDKNGICSETGTFLNNYNFDRNGYYWKEDENGNLYNTYSYFNDEGWTIDKKKFIINKLGQKIYSPIDERGFNIDHLYRPYKTASIKNHDERGFDYYGINILTGTHLDENQFDVNGYYWRQDENGKLVKTDSKYDDEGWSQTHINKDTNYHIDKHGFDYLHLYRYPSLKKNQEGKVSEYDPRGFNYLGIHRTTGKVYNKHHFDIDGYWYKKEGKEYIKTDSKFDADGYDIDRRDRHGFTKNGYYKKTRRKINEKGFFANGNNIYTNTDYDLDGLTIDGTPALNVDWGLIKQIQESHKFDKRMYIEDVIREYLTLEEWDEILSTYDTYLDEFEEQFDELTRFIALVQLVGINHNEEIFTEEEVLAFIRKESLKREQIRYEREVRGIYFDVEFRRLIEEGELSQSDIDETLQRHAYAEDIVSMLHF